jgi:signal transduction histidine kinase
MSGIDQSTKLFNTAIIATKIPKLTNYSAQLNELVQTPAFQFILKAIREYAASTGVSEEQAAEQMVQTFRDIDRVWDAYIFQEGLDKLKGHLTS